MRHRWPSVNHRCPLRRTGMARSVLPWWLLYFRVVRVGLSPNVEDVADRPAWRWRRNVIDRRRQADADEDLGGDALLALSDQSSDNLSARSDLGDVGQRAGGEPHHRRVEQYGGQHLTATQHAFVRVVVRRQDQDLGTVVADLEPAL